MDHRDNTVDGSVFTKEQFSTIDHVKKVSKSTGENKIHAAY